MGPHYLCISLNTADGKALHAEKVQQRHFNVQQRHFNVQQYHFKVQQYHFKVQQRHFKVQQCHFMTQFNSKRQSHMSTNCYMELKNNLRFLKTIEEDTGLYQLLTVLHNKFCCAF
jgi:hypothetical protein